MGFTVYETGEKAIASEFMDNWRHVNFGNDLIPVDAIGDGLDGAEAGGIECGTSSYRWKKVNGIDAFFDTIVCYNGIKTDTEDASDDSAVYISGGGWDSTDEGSYHLRGGLITVFGNEHESENYGDVHIHPGKGQLGTSWGMVQVVNYQGYPIAQFGTGRDGGLDTYFGGYVGAFNYGISGEQYNGSGFDRYALMNFSGYDYTMIRSSAVFGTIHFSNETESDPSVGYVSTSIDFTGYFDVCPICIGAYGIECDSGGNNFNYNGTACFDVVKHSYKFSGNTLTIRTEMNYWGDVAGDYYFKNFYYFMGVCALGYGT